MRNEQALGIVGIAAPNAINEKRVLQIVGPAAVDADDRRVDATIMLCGIPQPMNDVGERLHRGARIVGEVKLTVESHELTDGCGVLHLDREAGEAGVIGRVVLAAGETGEVGAPIAVLIADGDSDADIDRLLGSSTSAETETRDPDSAAPVVEASSIVSAAAEVQSHGITAAPSARTSAESFVTARQFMSPLARKLARERGVDLSAVTGTGPGGRIVRRDIDNHLESATPVSPTTPAERSLQPSPSVPVAVQVTPSPTDPGYTLLPHTGMRRAIARRLTESKSTVPHFYLTADCEVDDLLALRTQINESSPIRISVNDLVVKAAAAAFADVPAANVTWAKDGLHRFNTVDIAVAVAVEGGLLTPVVRDIGSKSLSAVSAAVSELAQKAKGKRLTQDELEGGSFSISNLGMYGTTEFSAILNQPQSGILAVDAVRALPVVIDGELAVGNVMTCTLSVDHRSIDGALAAQWLAAFTNRIEHPLGILI